MPAESKTLQCREESKSKLTARLPRSYNPGAPVVEGKTIQTTSMRKGGRRKNAANYASLPQEVLDKILEALVSDRKPLSVMLLSMVNREFRRVVDSNLKAWHKLYLLWRGHMRATVMDPGTEKLMSTVIMGRKGGTVRLVPTIPRSVPNFRDKHPPLAILLRVDKVPEEDASPEDKRQALFLYRKITVLRSSPCCGMCGTTRHPTRPFWCLGMRVCRYCLQANLVSHLVLYERFWVTLDRPVQQHATFIDGVAGHVFYFKEDLTPTQRLEYTTDRIDYPGGKQSVWFFWRPHLGKVLDMEALARDAKAKHAAALVVRSMVKRSLAMQALSGGRKWHPLQHGSKKDKRLPLFRLRKTELLDKVDSSFQLRLIMRMLTEKSSKLRNHEDRVVPLRFN